MWTALLLLIAAAWAGDEPGPYWSQFGAVVFQPTGLIPETVVGHKAPVMRYGGAVFNDTYAAAAARVTVSPAFVETGLRLEFQPIDVLPLRLEVVRSEYWRSPFGLLGADSVADGNPRARKPHYQAGESFQGTGVYVMFTPTFQIKLGQVVGFSSWNLTWWHLTPELGMRERLMWEPFRGMIVGFDDRFLESTSAGMWEFFDGEGQRLLRTGLGVRTKTAQVSGDHTIGLGPLVQFRPTVAATGPTFLVLIAPYLIDPDYVGGPPNVILGVTWEGGKGNAVAVPTIDQ